MAGDSEAAPVINGDDAATSATTAVADEIKLIGYAVRDLPAEAMNDFIRLGVCVRCIFRLFNIHEGIYALVSPSTLYSIVGKATEVDSRDAEILNSSQESEVKSSICTVCLGVLQFCYRDEQDIVIKKDHAEDFAIMVAECVKQKCHEIDSFSLEVSLPASITEHDQLFLSYIKGKYASDQWCQEKLKSGHISVKDAFKLSITHSIERLMGVESNSSDFRIRLTYEHHDVSSNAENRMGKNQCNKRMKTGPEVSSFQTSQGNGLTAVSDIKCKLTEVRQPCQMTLLCSRAPIYIGGRYLKFSRNVSQTRWIIDDERKGDASVEEIVGGNILPVCNGDGYKFHAAGREDIDVRMLGSGRPFLVEIQNARRVPSDLSIKEMENKINSMEGNMVRVKHLKVLGSQGWTLMREGEVEKQKQYAALVWMSRAIEDDDLQAVASLTDLKVLQKTPIRVLHRRSPLERERIIHWMKIEKIAGSSQYFLLHLCTQAGTYIKEFVHGDLGRTNPSLGSILGCRAEILQLDVTGVKMDCFLDE